MTDDPYSPRPLASWYMIAVLGALLFMIIGVAGYLLDVTTDPQTLPVDQRVVVEARPAWAMMAYGTAVMVGLAGTVLLAFRRKIAQPLLLVSLVAAVVTFLPYAITPGVRDNITTNDIAFALGILIITWTIFWFARHSAQRGWLR
ncbi:MAG TPA: hypothetical protein VFU80_08565 [Sphingomicrobium sp.]|nr:hypothetical protein [Sphingomicrobium sp.]